MFPAQQWSGLTQTHEPSLSTQHVLGFFFSWGFTSPQHSHAGWMAAAQTQRETGAR